MLPSNKGMEPTVKSVTPFAKRAKVAPLCPAAHPRRYTAQRGHRENSHIIRRPCRSDRRGC